MIDVHEVYEVRKNAPYLIILLSLGIVFLTLPVSGEAINDINQMVPTQYQVPGYGIEHTTPHPYLISRLNEKLAKIQSESSGYESKENNGVLTRTVTPYIIKPALRSTGENRLLVILVDFPDKTHGPNQTREEVMAGFNGPGTPGSFPPHDSVNGFYARSSYGKLNLTADVYGWYTAPHDRQYYEQMHSEMYGTGWRELATDCLNAFDGEIDYTRYDNDNDGDIDNVYLIWAGSEFNGFWGGFQIGGMNTQEWDGLTLHSIVWEPYSYSGPDGPFCPMVTNHETGHLLGLPDFYDYDSSVGPGGGVGRFDLMDGNMVDHNCFSKYLLDWIDPVVITGGEQTLYLDPSSESPDAVIIMPNGSTGLYSEFFMAQTRNPAIGNDNCSLWWYNPYKSGEWSSPGLAIWHVDASLNQWDYWMNDNSYSSHKMLRLMEADGLEEIERSVTHEWGPNDLYYSGQQFGPDTFPNSSRYDGSETGIMIDQISQEGTGMNLRIRIDSLNPVPIPPSSILDLHNTTYQQTLITWNWTDPSSADFDKVMVYLDGAFQSNVTKGAQNYTASSLNPGTRYTIATHTVGSTGLINLTSENHTAWTAPLVNPFPGQAKPPTSPDNDGLYKDVNGNGRKDFNDVVIFFKNIEWVTLNEPVQCFDYNGNGRIDFNDVVRLFKDV